MHKTSKKIVMALLALTSFSFLAVAAEPNISVFANFVRRVSKERNISLGEAADRLYALGVRGVDAGVNEKDLDQLAATPLKIINFYYFAPMFDDAKFPEDAKRCFDLAVKYGVPRIMVIPPNFTDGGDEAAEFAVILEKMKSFTAQAGKLGIKVTVEDFGGTKNACSHTKYLRRFLDEIPEIGFALDSGNLYYAGRGESILELMEYAKDRVAHIHLKDQPKENNRSYVTLGLGAVPNEAIVTAMARAGYTGWYTLENPVGDTYTDTVRQTAVLKSWLEAAKESPTKK